MSSIRSFKRFRRGRKASAFSIALVSTLVSAETVAGNTNSIDILNERQIDKVQQATLKKVVTSIDTLINDTLISDTLISERQPQHHYLNVVKAEAVLQQSLSSVQSLLLSQCEKIGLTTEFFFANLNRIIGKPIGFINANQVSQESTLTKALAAGLNASHPSSDLHVLGQVLTNNKTKTDQNSSDITNTKVDGVNINTIHQSICSTLGCNHRSYKEYETLAVSQVVDANGNYQYLQSIRANTNTEAVNEYPSADTVVINLQQYAKETTFKSPAIHLKISSANNSVDKQRVEKQQFWNDAAKKKSIINIREITLSMAELAQVESVGIAAQAVVIPCHRSNIHSINS